MPRVEIMQIVDPRVLFAQVPVPEWDGQVVRFMAEEDAFFDGDTVRYLDGRQTEIILVPRQ